VDTILMLAGTDADTEIKGQAARKRARRPPRGHYSLGFKLQVIKESLVPGASVSVVARRHDINTNVVFRWRKEFRDGKYGNRGRPNSFVTGCHLAVNVQWQCRKALVTFRKLANTFNPFQRIGFLPREGRNSLQKAYCVKSFS
jgi:transposase-like protein